MYIDSHCHLEEQTYGSELGEVIDRARRAGVTHFVAVGASRVAEGAREVLRLARLHSDIVAAVGIHPHDAKDAKPEDERLIAELVDDDKVVALGEIGLDYYYNNSPKLEQQAVFRRLLAVAKAANKPVMLHIRDAHEDAWAILDEEGLPARAGVVHCFTGNAKQAQEYLRRGMYLSIPGVVTFAKAEELQQAVRQMPLQRMLLETDSPYLAPVPYRGKRNEPSYIPATAAFVGTLRGISKEEVAQATSANAKLLFAIR